MKRYAVVAILTALGGCGKPKVECGAEDAIRPVLDIARKQIERSAANLLREGGTSVSVSKIRAATGQLGLSLADIRTSKEDPNSTKRFCVATLNLRAPAEAIQSANETRQATGAIGIGQLADNNGLERNADTFSSEVEFNVQPTDNGEMVFAELESGDSLFGFAGELLASSLLRAAVMDAQRQAMLAEQRRQSEEMALQKESMTAELDMVKSENQLALQTINATWTALASGTKKDLLAQQRAWSRKKDADCKLEAAASSLDSLAMEAARLRCDTRVTRERLGFLQQVRLSDPQVLEATPAAAESQEADGEDF